MKVINNIQPYLLYYIPDKQHYGILPFGCQIESYSNIVTLVDIDEWKNSINTMLGTDTWFDENKFQEELSNIKPQNIGYLTPYGFRLSVDNDNAQYLDSLLSDNDMVTIDTLGDQYTLSMDDYKILLDQYKQDKPLYLNTINTSSDIQ